MFFGKEVLILLHIENHKTKEIYCLNLKMCVCIKGGYILG